VDTEQEELEALKKWWKENGRVVVVGLVLGLGGVFGWTTWQSRVEASAERLSIVYQNMVDSAASDGHVEAAQQADGIIADHPDSEYAVLAGLLGAKSALAAGRPEDAGRFLDWVIENAARVELRDVARIRKARLLLDEGQHDAGLTVLDQVDTAAFAATVDELRGDILVESRDTQAAAQAYAAALASNVVSGGMRARVQMKLDDLGYGAEPGVSQ
jgi:predicted negative regulator of RcsB-dependent stress response